MGLYYVARYVLLPVPTKHVDVSQECNKEMLSTGELVPRRFRVTAPAVTPRQLSALSRLAASATLLLRHQEQHY
jgi:hypothetical protein